MLELKRISDRILQIIEYLNNLFTIRISKFSLEFKQRGWLSFTHNMNLSGIPPLSRKWKSNLLLFQRQLRYWKVFELSNIWTFFPFLAPKCRSELEWSGVSHFTWTIERVRLLEEKYIERTLCFTRIRAVMLYSCPYVRKTRSILSSLYSCLVLSFHMPFA